MSPYIISKCFNSRGRRGVCLGYKPFAVVVFIVAGYSRYSRSADRVRSEIAKIQNAMDFLKMHKTIYTYLDNNEAGKRTAQELKIVCKNVFDQSEFYTGHKDLNEYLCNQIRERKQRRQRGIRR